MRWREVKSGAVDDKNSLSLTRESLRLPSIQRPYSSIIRAHIQSFYYNSFWKKSLENVVSTSPEEWLCFTHPRSFIAQCTDFYRIKISISTSDQSAVCNTYFHTLYSIYCTQITEGQWGTGEDSEILSTIWYDNSWLFDPENNITMKDRLRLGD